MYSLQVNVTKRAECVVLPWQRQEGLAIAAIHSWMIGEYMHIKKFISITESLWEEDDGAGTMGG